VGSVAGIVALLACGNPVPEPGQAPAGEPRPATQGQAIKPPFAVRGELEGLLLVWFDAEGSHVAESRAEVPDERRRYVRVDSPRLSPDKRLDPEKVYIADLRAPQSDGSYRVEVYPRQWLDEHIDSLTPAVPASAGVTLYMASWCGACRSAAAFMRQRQVEFVERDIEKDPAANAEMLQKAKAAGKTPRGVPVIDFHGDILLGFDQAKLSQLIERHKTI
jgi:glutaredoxin